MALAVEEELSATDSGAHLKGSNVGPQKNKMRYHEARCELGPLSTRKLTIDSICNAVGKNRAFL